MASAEEEVKLDSLCGDTEPQSTVDESAESSGQQPIVDDKVEKHVGDSHADIQADSQVGESLETTESVDACSDSKEERRDANDTQPGTVSSVSSISQAWLQTLTRIRSGNQTPGEIGVSSNSPEILPGADASDNSRVVSLGQSLYSSTGQLLGAYQAWRYKTPEQNDVDAPKEVTPSSEVVDDSKENDVPLSCPEEAKATEASTDSKTSSFSKSIYATGEHLLNSVHAWRERKDDVAVQEQKCSSEECGHDPPVEASNEVCTESANPEGSNEATKNETNDDPIEMCEIFEKPADSKEEPVVDVPMGRRSTAEEWEVLEDLFVKCWRCGKLVSPHMEAIEKHSLICSRPSLREIEVVETKEEPEEVLVNPPSAEESYQIESVMDTEVALDGSGQAASTSFNSNPDAQSEGGRGLMLGQTLAVPQAPSSSSSFAISAVAMTAVTKLKNLGLEAKGRAYRHYCSRGVVLPDSVDVNIQMAHTALFLSCDGINTSLESAALGLRCDGVGEESAWVLIKLEADGVYKVKSALSGRCLLASVEADGVQICLGGSDASPEAEWRITKGAKGGSFVFQNVASGIYLAGKSAGVLDGTEVEAVQTANVDCDWIVAAVKPPQESGEEMAQPKSTVLDAITPDLDAYVLYARVEATMERSILMALDPVLHGIPALGIASAKEEAKKLKAEHGSADAAIAAMKSKIDTDEAPASLSGKILMKVSELLVLRFMPFAGAGAYLSFTLYTRLRLAALVAEIYGVDTDSAESQSMLLFCIAPDGSTSATENDNSTGGDQEDEEKKSSNSGVRNIVVGSARILSHTLARQVLKRATGWQTAADLYDLAAAVASEGYTHVRGDGNESETVEQEGGQQATFRRASLLFKPLLNKTVQPFTVAMLCVGAALPAVLSALRHILRFMTPIMGLQVTVACLVCVATSIGIFGFVKRWEILDLASELAYEHPELISSAVCIVHSALPLKAAFDATGTIVDGTRRGFLAYGNSEVVGEAVLILFLGLWSWLRILQRCLAEPNTAAARGESTNAQKVLVCTVLFMGAFDIFGTDGFTLHSWNGFGTLDSHHWILGLLSALALECQMTLITSLRERDTLLRLLGATRMMSLALVLFLGGLTASVGFLVSRSEFSRFVDTLAPPPQVMVVILTLRRRFYTNALVIGVGLGLLWQMPRSEVSEMFMRLLGLVVGVYGTAKLAITFEEYREPLLEPNGGRWLLLFPESSEKAREQALKVWGEFKQEAADKAISKGTEVVGRTVIGKALDYAASYWSRAPLEQVATAAIAAADKVD